MAQSALKKSFNPPITSQEEIELERYHSFISTLNGYEDYLLDKDGIILSSNLEVISITGYEEWEVIGSHLSKFYSLEDQLKGIPQNDLEKAAKKSVFITTGIRIKKKNSSFWAKINFRALTKQGQITGFKMTIQDITHRAVSSHRLKKLKDEYLNLFNNSFAGIFKVSLTDFNVLMTNEKAAKIFGLNGSKKKFNELFEEKDFHKLLQELFTKKRVEDAEVKLAGKDQWFRLSCRLFTKGNFAEGIMIDVTDYKRKDIELARVRNELDQFIYHASHEMRSPLATMLGIVNLIKREKDIHSILNYSALLNEKIEGLDQLLKSIVAISLNNNSQVSHDEVKWDDVVYPLVKEFKSSLPAGIKFEFVQTAPFISDLVRVKIILKNLISNAIKYSDPSNKDPKVDILISSEEDQAEIRITDNGIGITPEYRQEIFRMFYKATSQANGHGMGLYSAKVMVDKLGGRIEVESELGVGSTFKVFLPNRLVENKFDK